MGPLVNVLYFKLKMGHQNYVAFTDAVKKIAKAANKSKWPYYFTVFHLVGAGEGAPDYMVSSNYASFGDYGTGANPSMKKMVENVYGKQGQAAIVKAFGDAVESQSSHVDRVDADLTYTPAAH